MRAHFILNHEDAPAAKLAAVEIHFEEGLLAGLKLVGCSILRSKNRDEPTVLLPSRIYDTASGVRCFELLRDCESTDESDEGKKAVQRFKDCIRGQYLNIADRQTDKPKTNNSAVKPTT